MHERGFLVLSACARLCDGLLRGYTVTRVRYAADAAAARLRHCQAVFSALVFGMAFGNNGLAENKLSKRLTRIRDLFVGQAGRWGKQTARLKHSRVAILTSQRAFSENRVMKWVILGAGGCYRGPTQTCPISSFLLLTPVQDITGVLPHIPGLPPPPPRTASVNTTLRRMRSFKVGPLRGACILQEAHFEVTNQGEQEVEVALEMECVRWLGRKIIRASLSHQPLERDRKP